jgi:exodeoxyribonuclease VII small subunit
LSKSAPDSAAGQEHSFEQALERLETVVHDLEEGRIGLAESLARYEEGVKLLEQCSTLLERAERRIELLSGADSQGRAATEPFDDRAMSLEEKAQTRGRRRTKKNILPVEPCDENSSGASDVDESGTLF